MCSLQIVAYSGAHVAQFGHARARLLALAGTRTDATPAASPAKALACREAAEP